MCTGLRYHIACRHKGDLANQFIKQDELVEKRRKETVDKIAEAKRRREISENQSKLVSKDGKMVLDVRRDPGLQKRWDLAMVEFCSETFCSFLAASKVDILLRALWPNGNFKIKNKHSTTISRHVTSRASEVRELIYSVISSIPGQEDDSVGSAGFTTDIWTNRSLDSFMCLTAHLIDKNWVLHRFCPFVKYMNGDRHTAVNIKLRMKKFMENIGLDKPGIRRIVTLDNASNNRKMVRISQDLMEGVWCINHTLALAVKDLFKKTAGDIQIKAMLRKCQAVAVFVHRSELNKNALKKACAETKIRYRLPSLAVNTRWNSTDDNLNSNLKLKSALEYLVLQDTSREQSWRCRILTPIEYKAVESMHKALGAVKHATKVFEADKSVTINLVCVELYNVEDTLSKLILQGGVISQFAEQLKDCLNQRLPQAGTKNLIYSTAHFLDPRYKGCVLEEYAGVYEATKQEIRRIAAKYDKSQVSIEAPSLVEAEEDATLTAAERLYRNKRRRISGTSEDSLGSVSVPVFSQIDLELQSYEKLQVSFKYQLYVLCVLHCIYCV